MSNADLCCGCGQATISTGGIGCVCRKGVCKKCNGERQVLKSDNNLQKDGWCFHCAWETYVSEPLRKRHAIKMARNRSKKKKRPSKKS